VVADEEHPDDHHDRGSAGDRHLRNRHMQRCDHASTLAPVGGRRIVEIDRNQLKS
jgi:hypothetical protein